MRGCRCIDDFPSVSFEDFTLFFRQPAVGVIYAEPWPQRHKCGIDVDRVLVPREVHGMDAMVREVATNPLDASKVRGETVLYKKVFSQAANVGSIEQWLLPVLGHEVAVLDFFQAERLISAFMLIKVV